MNEDFYVALLFGWSILFVFWTIVILFVYFRNPPNSRLSKKVLTQSTKNILSSTSVADSFQYDNHDNFVNRKEDDFSNMDKKLALDMMRKEMLEASDELEFEKAAKLRDEIKKLEKELEGIF